MKILVSLSEAVWSFFEKHWAKKALNNALRQNDLSRETVIIISPDEFLSLAKPGHDPEKERDVKELIDNNIAFDSLPHLGVQTDENGNVYVSGNGSDHEGRHRVRALKSIGINKIPVIIVSGAGGDGESFRWGSTQRRPKYLIGYNGFKIKFPEIETYPRTDF